MPEREIREKYGGKLDKAINRAIRAETAGGNAALDLLAKLSGPAASSGWTDEKGNPTSAAAAYIKHREKVVAPLIAQVRKTWNLPPLKGTTSVAKKAGPKKKASIARAKR